MKFLAFVLKRLEPLTAQSGRLLARMALWLIGLIVLDRVVSFGMSPLWLFCGAAIGIIMAGSPSAQRLTSLGLWTSSALVALIYWIVQRSIATIVLPDGLGIFSLFNFTSNVNLIFLCFGLAFLSTWYVYRTRHALTIEFLLLAFAVLWLFAPHRDYRLDLVKFVTNLAWQFQLSPLATIVILSVLITGFLFWYLSYSPMLPNPFFRRWGCNEVVVESRTSWLARSTSFCLITLILVIIGWINFQYHQQVLATRLQNGVGSEDKEGLSPLGFHSSLGSSQEPTALVRLEGDYLENPQTPMLYFRESAVSKLEGNELVIANKSLDDDVAWTEPGQFFQHEGNPDHRYRTPLTQTIYSLVDMNLSFSIDYPISMVPLKLSDSNKKFKSAYRAYSMAPAYAPSMLQDALLGDPKWTPEKRAHYLETHPDPRYEALARKIVGETHPGIAYAFSVVNYLNKNAIYTLTPNHNVGDKDDPVAAFLFGDLRGYCVHFAYATTYMLRSLGVPARVGTGYLTDLSQAKDGHILLRMNDRHAWAEVYIRDIGWVPFDTQPEQVENHGEAPVDVNVLEELMGLLEPGEELLPSENSENEPGMTPDRGDFQLPEAWTLLYLFAAIVLCILAAKAFVIWGWRLPAAPHRKLERGLTGSAALLHDLGYSRQEGETIHEFQRRLQEHYRDLVLQSGELLMKEKYALGGRSSNADVIRSISEERARLFRAVSKTQYLKMLFGPGSLLKVLGGKRW